MMRLGHQTSTQENLLSLLCDGRDISHHVNLSLLTERMEHIKKYLKKFTTLLMVMMCVGAISITTNAAWGGIFDSNDNMNFQDTLHGKHLYTDSSFSVSLNQYTSGMPISGTRISTWKTNTDATQLWETRMGPRIPKEVLLLPNTNTGVALNVVRSNSGTQLTANLYPQIGNYYNDTVMVKNEINAASNFLSYIITTQSRITNGVTYRSLNLTVSSQPTPASDGNGTSKYCEFNTGSKRFYEKNG